MNHKFNFARISLGKFAALGVALATVAGSAEAGDLVGTSGSYKDYGGSAAVPVPAPNIIPERYNWYLRGDAGIGFPSVSGFSEQGALYGTKLPAGTGLVAPGPTAPFGNQPGWTGSGVDPNRTFGFGVGYYFAPHIRGDITLDNRSPLEVGQIKGSYSYTYDTLPVVPPGNPVTVNGNVSDRTVLRGGVGLANVYYDLTDRGGFTPYIGGGVGIALNRMDRTSIANEAAYNTTGTLLSTRQLGVVDTQYSGSFAAAAMVGFSYDIDPHWAIDVGYRFLYINGTSGSWVLNSGSTSTIKIGDTTEHQIRGGVRLNVW